MQHDYPHYPASYDKHVDQDDTATAKYFYHELLALVQTPRPDIYIALLAAKAKEHVMWLEEERRLVAQSRKC
jgi:hypothetical protein